MPLHRIKIWISLIFSALIFSTLHADPLAPSRLEVRETAANAFEIIWQTPERLPLSNPNPLMPIMPANCLASSEPALSPALESASLQKRWEMHCDNGIEGARIGVQNLVSRSANTLLRVELLDGRVFTDFLTPEASFAEIPDAQSRADVFLQYLFFGAKHLLVGLDHILFLITLLLLCGFTRQLVITITLLTLAHSITLGLTILGLIRFPVDIAEVFIALSIAFTCAAYIKRSALKDRVDDKSVQDALQSPRKVWLAAFGFGLLHGLGFASVLTELGVPNNEIAAALIAFNLGIELGQLIIVLPMLLIWRIVKRLITNHNLEANGATKTPGIQNAGIALSLGVGTLAALWFWERLAVSLALL